MFALLKTKFALLKTKIAAIGAAIIGALLLTVKFLTMRNKSLKKQRDQAEADLQFREDVDIMDEEIEQDFSHRAEEAQKDLDEGEIPDHLANPSNN